MTDVDEFTPRMVMGDDKQLMLDVNLEAVSRYFTCNLCHGLFREPVTIPECLHTFCKDCLIKRLRTTPECPDCKGKITIQSIKLDRNIEAVFQKLFADVEKQDAEQEKQFYKERNLPVPEKQSMQAGAQNGPGAKVKRASSAGSTGAAKKDDTTNAAANKRARTDAGPSSSTASGTAAASSAGPASVKRPPVKIKLTLQPEDPTLVLDKPYIEASGGIKVSTMRDYVADKFRVPKDSVEVFCNDEKLSPDHTTEFIQRTKWKDPSVNMVWRFRILGSKPQN